MTWSKPCRYSATSGAAGPASSNHINIQENPVAPVAKLITGTQVGPEKSCPVAPLGLPCLRGRKTPCEYGYLPRCPTGPANCEWLVLAETAFEVLEASNDTESIHQSFTEKIATHAVQILGGWSNVDSNRFTSSWSQVKSDFVQAYLKTLAFLVRNKSPMDPGVEGERPVHCPANTIFPFELSIEQFVGEDLV